MEYTVELRQEEPEIEVIDFEGTRLILEGALAWFYRFFRTLDCEEAAQRELYPWLCEAKKKNGVTTPDNAVSTLKEGH